MISQTYLFCFKIPKLITLFHLVRLDFKFFPISGKDRSDSPQPMPSPKAMA